VIPIVPCVFSVFVLRRRFAPLDLSRPQTTKDTGLIGTVQVIMSGWWKSFKRIPELWLFGFTLFGLLQVALFPQWIDEVRNIRLSLGHGFLFSPPQGVYYQYSDYVHIDYGLLAAQCLAITILGGIAILLAYGNRRKRSLQNTMPTTLLDRTQDSAGKIIITGYRHLAAQHGCAPTQATSDQQIVEIYRKVGTAFKNIARERGEELQAGYLNTVILKFLQVKEKMGEVFMDEHLAYELDKYRQEGFRPDYKKVLNLV
jgi:hypothetical protein